MAAGVPRSTWSDRFDVLVWDDEGVLIATSCRKIFCVYANSWNVSRTHFVLLEKDQYPGYPYTLAMLKFRHTR